MDQDTLYKIIDIIATHNDNDGGYCDTGDDMDWYCRSGCVRMAIERLRKAFDAGKI